MTGRARYDPIQSGLILGHGDRKAAAVGLFGSYDSLQRLSQEYAGYAEFPELVPGAIRQGNALLFPPSQRSEDWAENKQWIILFEFSQSGLERAEQQARQTGVAGSGGSGARQLSRPVLPEKGGMGSGHKMANPS